MSLRRLKLSIYEVVTPREEEEEEPFCPKVPNIRKSTALVVSTP
jgi:hypothetical protein